MLVTRLLTALVAVPIGLFLVYLGGWYLFGLIAVFMLTAQHEFLAAAHRRGCTPSGALVYLFGLGLLVTMRLRPHDLEPCAILSVVFVMMALAIETVKRTSTHIADTGVTLTAFFYLAWLFGYFMLLREVAPGREGHFIIWKMPFGWCLMVYGMGVTWLTDTGAYLIGRNLGKRRLCPGISPGKTVEGSYGALLTAVATSIILGQAVGFPVAHAAFLGIIVGLVGQIGDLSKSVMKREVGIKDFGTFFPGHGGVIDRFDAMLFNSFVIYYYVSAVMLPLLPKT